METGIDVFNTAFRQSAVLCGLFRVRQQTVSFIFCRFVTGLSIVDFKDADYIEAIEYRNKSGINVTSGSRQK